MKKAISITVVVFCIALYYCSNSATITEAITDLRQKHSTLSSIKYQYGGLYGISFLSEYRIPFSYKIKNADSVKENSINLFLFSDSYLYYPTRKHHYYGVDSLYKIKFFESHTNVHLQRLDKDKKNVIIIEMTERYVRSICADYHSIINMLTIDSINTTIESIQLKKHPFEFTKWQLFNPNINSNIEINLFDNNLFRPLKELKSDFNYYCFNRVNKDVFVDKENNFLFYSSTLTGDYNTNSFFPLQEKEIEVICMNLNKVYTHYKKYGFDEIYLSIIPNPVTMINPSYGRYNKLIPLLYNSDSLNIKIIDIYTVFQKNPQSFYSRNDTHWNSLGLQTWLNVFNKELKKNNEQIQR